MNENLLNELLSKKDKVEGEQETGSLTEKILSYEEIKEHKVEETPLGAPFAEENINQDLPITRKSLQDLKEPEKQPELIIDNQLSEQKRSKIVFNLIESMVIGVLSGFCCSKFGSNWYIPAYVFLFWTFIRQRTGNPFQWFSKTLTCSLLYYLSFCTTFFLIQKEIGTVFSLLYMPEILFIVIGGILIVLFNTIFHFNIKFSPVILFVSLIIGGVTGWLLGNLNLGAAVMFLLVGLFASFAAALFKKTQTWLAVVCLSTISALLLLFTLHFNAIAFFRYSWYEFLLVYSNLFYALVIYIFMLLLLNLATRSE